MILLPLSAVLEISFGVPGLGVRYWCLEWADVRIECRILDMGEKMERGSVPWTLKTFSGIIKLLE